MKKGAVITAVVLIVLGLSLFIGGLAAGGSFQPIEVQEKTYTVTEPFTDIHIDTHETDIVFARTADAASVFCNETDKLHCSLNTENGTLTVATVDERTWVDRLVFGHTMHLTVYLPESEYQTLTIENETGNVEIPADFSFESISVKGSTGNIRCGASVAGSLSIAASTGDITLEQIEAQQLSLTVSTGDIRINGAAVQEDVRISVSTGKTELNGMTCDSLTSHGSTGRITLKNCGIRQALSIKRSTGDVCLDDTDGGSIAIETDTGDVLCTLRSEMVFVTKTDTGEIRVPDTHSGGRCEITTSTGDITVSYAKEQQP